MDSPEKLQSSSNGGLYELAAGLLWRDRIFLVTAYPILILPYLIELTNDELSLYSGLIFRAFERLAQLLFLLWVIHRWVAQLSLDKSATWSRGLPKLLAFGFFVWIGLGVPYLVQHMALGLQERIIFLVLTGPALVFWFRYYFYFFPCVLGIKSNHAILAMARTLTVRDPYLPWRTLIAPFAILSLIFALITAISPDGRMLAPHYLMRLFEGTFWCLSTYLSLAAVIVYLPEKEWRESNLDPYREARLTTIALGAPALLHSLLSMKSGFKIMAVSIIVWFANVVQLYTMLPAPTIKVEKIVLKQDVVDLTISLSDPDYHFRGFLPMNFALAGEERVMVSIGLPVSVEDQSKKDVTFGIAEEKEQTTITTTFKTNRTGESLKSLQDLYLWYGTNKIVHLKLDSAIILPEAPVATPVTPLPQQ